MLGSARLNRCFIPQAHEQIASTFAAWAFFIAVISGCLAVRTFDPVRWFGGNCVSTTATLFADGLAATTVGDPHVVTNTTTLGTTGNRQVSLHF